MIAFAIDLVNYRVYANMSATAFTTFFRTASLANSSSTFLEINRYNALCISWHVKLAEISVDRVYNTYTYRTISLIEQIHIHLIFILYISIFYKLETGINKVTLNCSLHYSS